MTVVEACEIFVTPASVLVVALSVASTHPLKTLVSLLGLLTCGLWTWRVWMIPNAVDIDKNVALSLSILFAISFAISTFVHSRKWRSETRSAST